MNQMGQMVPENNDHGPDARRNSLTVLQTGRCVNAHLAFHSFLKNHDKGAYAKHVKSVSGIKVSDAYQHAYAEWVKAMKCIGAKILDAELTSPMIVGTGNVSPTEFGITLHPTYGVPYIPGTGVKGMCRRAATTLAKEQQLDEDHVTVLFGSDDDEAPNRGFVTFWDAWLHAEQGAKPLQSDVLTPHHPGYQAGPASNGDVPWPSSSDDPNPVSFLSVRPTTRFTFALSAPEAPEYLPLAKTILRGALEYNGVGAKTNVGYGRMTFREANHPVGA